MLFLLRQIISSLIICIFTHLQASRNIAECDRTVQQPTILKDWQDFHEVTLTLWASNSAPEYLPKGNAIICSQKTCTWMFAAAL